MTGTIERDGFVELSGEQLDQVSGGAGSVGTFVQKAQQVLRENGYNPGDVESLIGVPFGQLVSSVANGSLVKG